MTLGAARRLVRIGAVMVGSVHTGVPVVKKGDQVKRLGDEFGYFAFGECDAVCVSPFEDI